MIRDDLHESKLQKEAVLQHGGRGSEGVLRLQLGVGSQLSHPRAPCRVFKTGVRKTCWG